MTGRTFRIDTDRVVHDLNDGEVLAIRSDTGTYYSMLGPAADVWSALDAGADLHATAEMLTGRYEVERGTAEAAVEAFVDRLAQECLVAASPTGSAGQGTLPQPCEPRLAWEPPALQVYTDMQDLLLFDPIHEVGPEGWPAVADDTD